MPGCGWYFSSLLERFWSKAEIPERRKRVSPYMLSTWHEIELPVSVYNSRLWMRWIMSFCCFISIVALAIQGVMANLIFENVKSSVEEAKLVTPMQP